ncbi:putative dehydrogenase [Klebsiella pneumoniae]|nr:putative dehydrogenase [Klebsiella pneumoniae]
MSKMIHDQPSAAAPASRDRRNFLIAGAGLALAATTLGRSGAVMAKPAGQDTLNAPSDAAYPHLIENSGAPQVRLTDRELREIDAALAKIPLQGGRADPFTESQFDKS